MQTATVAWIGDEKFVATSPSGHAMTIDSDRQSNKAPGPMEMLLMALGACTATDVASILAKKRESITDYRVEVSGERRNEVPRSFETIHVHHVVRGHSLSERAVAHAIDELLDHPKRRVAYGKRSLEIAKQHDVKIVIPEFVRLYEDVIAESRESDQ